MIKTKSQLRAESEKALKKFLRAGGEIQVGRKPRDRKITMSSKSSRGYVTGTSGFSSGFPRKSAV